MSVSLAALSMAEERSLLPSEGSSRGPRGGGRAIEDGRVEEALVGVHARTRARGSRDEESVMLKLIKLGEICPIVQTRESLFNLPLLSRHQEPARCSRSAGSWRHRHFLFHSTCNAQRREVTLLSVSVRQTGHRLTHVSAASSHSMPVAYSGVVWEGSMGSDVCLVSLSLPTA